MGVEPRAEQVVAGASWATRGCWRGRLTNCYRGKSMLQIDERPLPVAQQLQVQLQPLRERDADAGGYLRVQLMIVVVKYLLMLQQRIVQCIRSSGTASCSSASWTTGASTSPRRSSSAMCSPFGRSASSESTLMLVDMDNKENERVTTFKM